jgi:putative holliday junction resolvase
MPIILGLDIGDVRIGVALSDELGIAAHPLCTITRKNRKRDLDTLRHLIETHKVERVVVGLPLRLNGEFGIQAQKVQKFAHALKRSVDIPIDFWDERLTTVEAEQILRNTKKRGKKRKKVIDQVAAVLILDEYLNQFRK